MLQPCLAAMLDGAVMANNPPTGLTAVPDNGSTNAATSINAIFAALPHANTNTRNVLFLRPNTRYFTNARIDITADGTQVLCGGGDRPTLQNTTSSSYAGGDPWFRGSGLAPAVRMENVEHCRWHGGGWRAAASTGVEGGTVFEMATARFCVIATGIVENMRKMFQANGVGSGEWTELCFVRDTHVLNTSTVGGDDRESGRFGGIVYRTTNGKTRCCGLNCLWTAGNRFGPGFE